MTLGFGIFQFLGTIATIVLLVLACIRPTSNRWLGLYGYLGLMFGICYLCSENAPPGWFSGLGELVSAFFYIGFILLSILVNGIVALIRHLRKPKPLPDSAFARPKTE